MTTFINDLDKVYDLLKLQNKREFLQSYSYLTVEDYDDTLKDLRKPEEVAYILREVENTLLEESNDRVTCWNVTGEQVKEVIADYVYSLFTEEEIREFEEVCKSMKCYLYLNFY